jgi:hypothetical protein
MKHSLITIFKFTLIPTLSTILFHTGCYTTFVPFTTLAFPFISIPSHVIQSRIKDNIWQHPLQTRQILNSNPSTILHKPISKNIIDTQQRDLIEQNTKLIIHLMIYTTYIHGTCQWSMIRCYSNLIYISELPFHIIITWIYIRRWQGCVSWLNIL